MLGVGVGAVAAAFIHFVCTLPLGCSTVCGPAFFVCGSHTHITAEPKEMFGVDTC